MGLRDPHDRRFFQHFVKLDDEGGIASTVQFADGSLSHTEEHPLDNEGSVYLNVTDLYPYDFTDVKLKTPINKMQPNRAALVAELARANRARGRG